jgi:hypothetical protein
MLTEAASLDRYQQMSRGPVGIQDEPSIVVIPIDMEDFLPLDAQNTRYGQLAYQRNEPVIRDSVPREHTFGQPLGSGQPGIP